jgi:hypothetical protein
MPRSREIGASATETIVVLIGLRSGPTSTGMRSFGPNPEPSDAAAVDAVVVGTGLVDVGVSVGFR